MRANRKLILGDADAVSQSAHLADDSGPSEVVETAEYDWLVANQFLPVPRVVKMDIEGHEFAALKGMSVTLSNPSCAALFCEVHPLALPKGVAAEQVIQLIRSFGFDSIRTWKRSWQLHLVATRETASCSPGETLSESVFVRVEMERTAGVDGKGTAGVGQTSSPSVRSCAGERLLTPLTSSEVN